ncbi:MAG TPA: class IV adenylate cyclase [Candidatus Paceibacterota bacterium]
MREIEVKMRVADMGALEQALTARGCVLGESMKQEDVIYGEPENNIYEKTKLGHVAIRIRNQDGKFELTAKKNLSGELDNIEYELEIMDRDQMHAILVAIGWVPIVEVKKTRRKAKLGEYEVCLDEVEELGNFAELEKLTSDNADPVSIQEQLLQEMESLGVSRSAQEIRGYDTLMYRLRHAQNN